MGSTQKPSQANTKTSPHSLQQNPTSQKNSKVLILFKSFKNKNLKFKISVLGSIFFTVVLIILYYIPYGDQKEKNTLIEVFS